MILERTLTNGDTIKTALLDAERLKKRVTFYTRTRSMIDKYTCRDTENKPITLGRFTISGGLIYYKSGEYSWQNISLDDVLKIDISEPETAPEETPKKRELRPGDRTGIYSKESGKEYIFTGNYDTMTYNGRACVFLATDPENKNTFARWSQQDLEQRGFIIPEKEQTPKTKRGSFYTLTNAGTIKKDGYIYNSGRNTYGIDNRGTTSRPRWTATDILSGLQVGSERPTKAAAIETALYYESKVIEQHNDLNNATMQKALTAIADAYKNNPIDNDAPRRPVKYGYIVYKYTSTSGTARAAIAPAKNPDCYYMDIPESDLPRIIQQISQETPKAYFIDKTTGLDIIPEGTPASTPTAKTESKRNRLPRKFTKLYITMLTDTTAGQAGTRATVYRNKYGELVEETESGELYAANLALLRTADLVRIDRIETEEPTPDATPADVIPEESPAKEPAAAPEESPAEDSPTLYKYGMRSRGYSIGAQPAGVAAREDDPTGIYYDIICYERELTPAELDHYSLDPLQPAPDPAQAASQDARTTLPPGPETVTESTNSQPEAPAAAHDARPRRGLTSPARTASHTNTHGEPKTRYKAKYKASRSHAGPPQNPRFFKSTYFLDLVFKNPAKTKPIRFIGPVFEQVLGKVYTKGPPPGYQKMMRTRREKKIKIKKEV